MNLLKTFESRISDAFGAAPDGYTAPFSFKKLAKRAAREMENETYEIDGVDTAPALYTLLVSPDDDAAMRPLYPQLTSEIAAFVEAQAHAKRYVFVGKPLARFMVDPSLKSGRFAIFAENIDAGALSHLREEERAFLSGSQGDIAPTAPVERRRRRERMPQAVPSVDEERSEEDSLIDDVPSPIDAPSAPAQTSSTDDSSGLDVIPDQAVDQAIQDIYDNASIEPPAVAGGRAIARDEPIVPLVTAPDDSYVRPVSVPATQRRNVPLVNHQRSSSATEHSAATCLLIDHQSGRTYRGTAPATTIGRERIPGGIVLQDPNASRRHAKLSYDGRSWHIADLGSTNGTLVNDVDVDVHTLHDGDILTIGLTNLVFREKDS